MEVGLVRTLELLTTHLTKSLCGEVFQSVRQTERQRKWSLEALIAFWTEVVLRAPESLTQALEEVSEVGGMFTRKIKATPEAFFQKCESFNPAFFLGVLERFVRSMLEIAPTTYAQSTLTIAQRFGAVVMLDGSRLEAIRHRLKILWNQRSVILPGCLTALYDVHRGFLRRLEVSLDAAEGEIRRAERILEHALAEGGLAIGSLIVGDRYYCTAAFFKFLAGLKLYGLSRRNRRLKIRKMKRLKKGRLKGGARFEDWLVETGASPNTPILTLRWIRVRFGRKRVYEVLTNVLDSEKLTAAEAIQLYVQRWSIERMFYDLKVVLNLNRIYAANGRAVAMQVYASAIVYCALRVAQAEIARDAGILPEQISTHKFFARLSAAVGPFWMAELGFIHTREVNRSVKLNKPTWERFKFARVRLKAILCEPRNSTRRKRRFCKARRRWKPLPRVAR